MNKIIQKYKNLPKPVKASIVFTIASFLSQGMGIISTPIFTRILTTEEMGMFTTYTSWVGIIGLFSSLGLTSGSFNIAMMQYKDKRNQYISSILTLSTLMSLLLCAVYAVFYKQINQLFEMPGPVVGFMMISFIFTPATTFWMMRQRYEYKYINVACVTFFTSVMGTVFTVCSVLICQKTGEFHLGIIRIFASNLVVVFIACIIYIYIFVKGKTGFHKEYWKNALILSLPLMIHALAKQILDLSDRTMISKMRGKSEVGIYGVLYSVSALSLILWNAINASLIPYIFEHMEKGRSGEEKINRIVKPILCVYGICCIGFTLVAPEIVKILATKEYYSAIYLMPPIAGGIFCTSLYNVYSNMLLYYKKTSLIMWATLSAAIVNIILNYIFIPRYGFIAAAYTTLFAHILLAFCQFMAVMYVRKGRWVLEEKKIWFIASVTVIVCLLSNLLYKKTLYRYMAIGIIISLILIFRKRLIKILKEVKGR